MEQSTENNHLAEDKKNGADKTGDYSREASVPIQSNPGQDVSSLRAERK